MKDTLGPLVVQGFFFIAVGNDLFKRLSSIPLSLQNGHQLCFLILTITHCSYRVTISNTKINRIITQEKARMLRIILCPRHGIGNPSGYSLVKFQGSEGPPPPRPPPSPGLLRYCNGHVYGTCYCG